MARRRWPAVGRCVTVSCATLLAVACGTDPDAAPTTIVAGTSTVPPTTARSTTASAPVPTAPASTSPESPAPTSIAPPPVDTGAAGFVPQCVEQPGDGVPPPSLDGPDVLGPLGAAPAFVIDLPRFRGASDEEPGDVAAALARIPGGLLVKVSQDSYGLGTGWQLTAVTDDGTVRWRRCGGDGYVQGPIVVGDGATPTTGMLWSYTADGVPTLLAFDLATGADVAPPDLTSVTGLGFLASTDRFVLFGRTDDARVDSATDRMRLLDLVDGSIDAIPYPERAVGQEPFNLIWQLVPGDGGAQPSVLQYDPFGAVVGAFVAGGWTTDREAIDGLAPPTVRETYADDPGGVGIEAIGSGGDRLWFHATEGSLPGEGFHTSVVGDTVLANVCRTAAADRSTGLGCDRSAFVALDLASGDVRWELPGFRQVGVADGGYAIVSDEPGADGASTAFEMIDLATGGPVPGQSWGPDAFRNGCCGESEYVYVGNDRGVVWAVVTDHVDVYYPAA